MYAGPRPRATLVVELTAVRAGSPSASGSTLRRRCCRATPPGDGRDQLRGGDEDHASDHEDRHDHADQSDHDIERHQRSRPIATIQNAPAARIDGTQRPTKTPSWRWSVNQRVMDRTNDAEAATRKRVAPRRCGRSRGAWRDSFDGTAWITLAGRAEISASAALKGAAWLTRATEHERPERRGQPEWCHTEADVLLGAALIEVASGSAGAASALTPGAGAAARMPVDAWISSIPGVSRAPTARPPSRALGAPTRRARRLDARPGRPSGRHLSTLLLIPLR